MAIGCNSCPGAPYACHSKSIEWLVSVNYVTAITVIHSWLATRWGGRIAAMLDAKTLPVGRRARPCLASKCGRGASFRL
jgi:hypothetical protein